MTTYKFGSLVNHEPSPYSYPNVWCREVTTGPDRLVLAPSSGHVEVLLRLSAMMDEPFGLLYVLLVSRRGRESGRYQSHRPLGRDQLIAFLSSYRAFLEGDARHHLWIMSLPDRSQLIYDNHNVIYAYGKLDAFVDGVRALGMVEEPVRFPVPHTHCYNEEFDPEEDRIFAEHQWLHFPLQPSDDP